MVSIIIVNYNGKRFLDACLSSVQRQDFTNYEVIVVDNGSSDGSLAFIQEHYPRIILVDAGCNLGFAGGNNLGYGYAKGDLVVLLNNDTVVSPSWLSGLVQAVAPPSVAAASSLILTKGIPVRYYEKNGSINFFGHNIMRIFNISEDIFYPGGASLIYKRALVGQPFDDLYFAYGEDVWLGLRIRFMGHQIRHTNDSVLDHVGSATTTKFKSSLRTYYQERNRLLNMLLFFSPVTIIKIAPLLIANSMVKIIASILPTKYSFSGLMHAYGWLIYHVPVILAKRKNLAKDKRVHERVVIAQMTCRVTNGETMGGRLMNAVSYFYHKIVGLKTIEFYG